MSMTQAPFRLTARDGRVRFIPSEAHAPGLRPTRPRPETLTNVMARLDPAIALSIVLPPLARSSRAMTILTTENQSFGGLVFASRTELSTSRHAG